MRQQEGTSSGQQDVGYQEMTVQTEQTTADVETQLLAAVERLTQAVVDQRQAVEDLRSDLERASATVAQLEAQEPKPQSIRDMVMHSAFVAGWLLTTTAVIGTIAELVTR